MAIAHGNVPVELHIDSGGLDTTQVEVRRVHRGTVAVVVARDELAVIVVDVVRGIAAVMVEALGIDTPGVGRGDGILYLHLVPVDGQRGIGHDALERGRQHQARSPGLGLLVAQRSIAGDVGQLQREIEIERSYDVVGVVRPRVPRRLVDVAARTVDQVAAQLDDLRPVHRVGGGGVAPGVERVGHAGIAARETHDAGGGAGIELRHVGRAVGQLVAAAQAYVIDDLPVDQGLVGPDIAGRVVV